MKRKKASDTFSFLNLTRDKLPWAEHSFRRIKEATLGKRYTLSIAFLSPRTVRTLNRRYRRRDKPTEILSFSLGEKSGEILLSPTEARRRASRFSRGGKNFIQYLVIHGLLHLKGFRHGRTMEREEEKIRKKFGV